MSQDTVSFDISAADRAVVRKIVKRAAVEDGLSLSMDLVATHANGCPLDLRKLLAFDDFNFWHDISGIQGCLDRETGALLNHFRPRCARREAVAA